MTNPLSETAAARFSLRMDERVPMMGLASTHCWLLAFSRRMVRMTARSLACIAAFFVLAACVSGALPPHPLFNQPGGVLVLGSLAVAAAIAAATVCVRRDSAKAE